MTELEQIQEILAREMQINPELLQNNATMDDLGLDSLAVLELLMIIEDSFEISIDDEEATKLTTVGQLADLVEQKSKY
ncbi:MAG: acyl carrier protein [Clostridiales bacterium]|jgi:acyl carrier protein|nr:acyl carrier protein [Clostridiales bacterium]